MRTKACMLGAVLGAASVLPGMCLSPEFSAHPAKEPSPREQAPRPEVRPVKDQNTERQMPAGVPAAPRGEAPTHPCELITVMRVPCDPAEGVCEYTYWECLRNVKPLRA